MSQWTPNTKKLKLISDSREAPQMLLRINKTLREESVKKYRKREGSVYYGQ